MVARSRSIAFAVLAAVAALSRGALADPPTRVDEDEIDPDAGTKRPAAPDTRAGHVYASAGFGTTAIAGSFARSLAAADAVGAGPTFFGSLGVGISRVTVLSLLGGYQRFGAPGTCAVCTGGSSFHVGAGASYHLAQGLAFDPWIQYGVAFRQASVALLDPGGTAPAKYAFRGIDLAKISFGGDFYPLPQLGLGAQVGLDVGTFTDRPASATGGSAYALFSIGLRVAIDPFRSAPRRAVARAAEAPSTTR